MFGAAELLIGKKINNWTKSYFLPKVGCEMTMGMESIVELNSVKGQFVSMGHEFLLTVSQRRANLSTCKQCSSW